MVVFKPFADTPGTVGAREKEAGGAGGVSRTPWTSSCAPPCGLDECCYECLATLLNPPGLFVCTPVQSRWGVLLSLRILLTPLVERTARRQVGVLGLGDANKLEAIQLWAVPLFRSPQACFISDSPC